MKKIIVYSIVDVGGQTMERKKWKNCFDNVNVLIYMVSLSDYDEILPEDVRVSRMMDSLSTFEDTVNGQVFKNTPIILWFNKSDELQRKMKMEEKNYNHYWNNQG